MDNDTNDSPRQAELGNLWMAWRLHRRFIVGYAATLNLRSGLEADDLVGDVLLRAAEATLRGSGPTSEPRAWFRTLLHHAFIDQHRKRHRTPVSAVSEELDSVPDESPGPERALARREAEQQVLAGIEALPKSWRQALEMRVVQAHSYANIAACQSISAANARKRVQLARARVRAASGDDGYRSSRASRDSSPTIARPVDFDS